MKQHFAVGIFLGILISSGLFSLLGFKYSSLSVKFDRAPLNGINNVDDEVHNFTLLSESLQKERQSILKKACQSKAQKHIHVGNLYSKTYKLSVCDIYKCGFSSWLKAVYVMEDYYTVDDYVAGKIHGDKIINLARKKIRIMSTTNVTEMKRNWNESFKVILVRHPFDRIVSAYNGKMVPTGKGFTLPYRQRSERINTRYRILRHKEEDRNKTNDTYATFEDFVNFLLLENSSDGHWKFYHEKCEPCLSKYDYIAKFETLSDDMDYLKKYLNISKEHQRAMFPKRAYNTTTIKMKKHFKQIPKSLAWRLYLMYKKDFDLFGYETPEWLC